MTSRALDDATLVIYSPSIVNSQTDKLLIIESEANQLRQQIKTTQALVLQEHPSSHLKQLDAAYLEAMKKTNIRLEDILQNQTPTVQPVDTALLDKQMAEIRQKEEEARQALEAYIKGNTVFNKREIFILNELNTNSTNSYLKERERLINELIRNLNTEQLRDLSKKETRSNAILKTIQDLQNNCNETRKDFYKQAKSFKY